MCLSDSSKCHDDVQVDDDEPNWLRRQRSGLGSFSFFVSISWNLDQNAFDDVIMNIFFFVYINFAWKILKIAP